MIKWFWNFRKEENSQTEGSCHNKNASADQYVESTNPQVKFSLYRILEMKKELHLRVTND